MELLQEWDRQVLDSGAMVPRLKHLVPRPHPSNSPDGLVAPDEYLFVRYSPLHHFAISPLRYQVE
ncbi:MAG: hypothetical protein ABDI19_04345 [Armatimonadota bacterium]